MTTQPIPQLCLAEDDILLVIKSFLKEYTARHSGSPVYSLETEPEMATALSLLAVAQQKQAFLEALSDFFCLPELVQYAFDDLTPGTLYKLALQIAESHEGVLCFHTSGSTGIPQPHHYQLLTLWHEIQAVLPYLPFFRRVVTVMPMHHIFGFVFSLLLPKWAQRPRIQLPPIPTGNFFSLLEADDLVIAFPFFWKNIVELLGKKRQEECFSLPVSLHALCSTAPCPKDIPIQLVGQTCSPFSSFTEIYGSTETSAVGIKIFPEEAYTLLDNWDVTLQTSRPDAILRRRNDEKNRLDHLPDIVEWISSRMFSPKSRRDKAVQVGGKNVYPQHIASILCKHPAIRDCTVRLMRPDEGMRLKAFIVPVDFTDETLEQLQGNELKKWCLSELGAPSTPKIFTIGTSLPRTATGKVADWDSTSNSPPMRRHNS